MWTSTQYRRVVRGSAWYDLIVTAAFITPWSFAALHGVLLSVSQAFDLPGDLPPFEPMHMLMANLLVRLCVSGRCCGFVIRSRCLVGMTRWGGFCFRLGSFMPWPMAPVRCW